RYAGTFSRSFYVGDEVTEQDIKASFDNGELKVTFPKEVKTIPEKKQIMID
ncbi:MAG TPA: Hsp20 family protein, partial [Candidatus Fimiplasma intestinipullorum]|nr:Hsp20 family protein [Candidatus Fimiplasma intestinipullorum]